MAIPENRYLAAFGCTGKHIEEQAHKIAKDDFRWLKAQPSRPAFADLIFAIGCKIFAVLMVECKSSKRLFGLKPEVSFSIPKEEQQLIIEESSANNLIPVIFPLYLDKMLPLSTGWNLFTLPDMKSCNPLAGGIDTSAVPMSPWELSSFRVQIDMTDIEKRGWKILSYQDIPGIMPHVWFENEKGERCWVAVIDKEDEPPETQASLRRTAARITSHYRGYLARVGARDNPLFPSIPMRGTGLIVAYTGLEEINL